jgi:threonine/homoserine/homoserine lactone efflux protein
MVTIVQDAGPAAVVDWAHAVFHDPAAGMSHLLGLAVFAFAVSVTPGPNNALLLASGIRFGLRRTLGHVAGTAVGMGVLVLVMAAGVGVVVLAVPGLQLALRVAGSAYLLYLAVRILGSHGAGRTVISRPLGLPAGAAFQLANPKAWLFALTAAASYLPASGRPLAGGAAVAVTSAVVICGTAALWAGGGAAMGRLVEGGPAQRAVNLTLAVVLAASVALIWV